MHTYMHMHMHTHMHTLMHTHLHVQIKLQEKRRRMEKQGMSKAERDFNRNMLHRYQPSICGSAAWMHSLWASLVWSWVLPCRVLGAAWVPVVTVRCVCFAVCSPHCPPPTHPLASLPSLPCPTGGYLTPGPTSLPGDR